MGQAIAWLMTLPVVLAALVLATRGWLLHRPDSARRCWQRYVAVGLMFVVTSIWGCGALVDHRWGWLVFDSVAAFCWYYRASAWYHRLDAARQAERLTAVSGETPA